MGMLRDSRRWKSQGVWHFLGHLLCLDFQEAAHFRQKIDLQTVQLTGKVAMSRQIVQRMSWTSTEESINSDFMIFSCPSYIVL